MLSLPREKELQTPGTGSASLPAYIVSEDMIEYHWLGDQNPRVFQLGMTGATGEITLPQNALGLFYNEIEVTYTAGCDPLPDAVKTACALAVRNIASTPSLNVRASSIESAHLEYFSGDVLDANTRTLLAPYVAQRVG
jgi:hypothetical protein